MESYMAKWLSNFHEQTLEIIKFINLYVSEPSLIAVPAIIAALLIPIVFFILGKNDSYAFDNNVVIDKVLLYKYLLFLIVLTSFCMIFHALSFMSVFLNILLLVLSAIVLNRSYKWLMARDGKNHALTYRQEQRIKYLKSLKSDAEILEIWDIIFSDKNLSEKNQFGFVEVLIETLEKYEKGKIINTKKTYLYLIERLNRKLEKIDFSDIEVYERLVSYSLSYYDKNDKNSGWTGTKKVILFGLLEYTLQKTQYELYPFFEQVQEFLNKQTDKQKFIRSFYCDLLCKLKKIYAQTVSINALWQIDFLKNNVVTKEKLEGQSQQIASIILDIYVKFALQEMHDGRENINLFFDFVTHNMLPNIDSILWFRALSFYVLYWESNRDDLYQTVKRWCTTKRNFRHISRGYSEADIDMQQRKQAEKEETIYILNLLLSKYFNIQISDKKELNTILKAIEQIREDSVFEANSKESVNLDILESNTKLFLNED